VFRIASLKRIAARTAGIAAGFVLAFVAFLLFTPPYSNWPSYDRAEIARYRAFSPALADQEKHILIGSCEVAIPIVANNLDVPGYEARLDQSAWLGNIMSFLVTNRYGREVKAAFYEMAAPSTELPHHLLFFYNALKVPNLRSVIYVGGLSVSHTGLTTEDALELVAVLDSFARDYPGSMPYVRIYRDYVVKGDAYKAGLAKYGAGWRNLLDPETLSFPARGVDVISAAGSPRGRQDIQVRFKKFLRWIFGSPAETARQALDAVTDFSAKVRDWKVRSILDWAARFYGRPDNYVYFETAKGNPPYLAGDDAELNRAYMLIMAEVARAKGIKLVLYAQPMLYFTPEYYRTKFRRNYTDVLSRWLAGYDVAIIDHTLDHDLNQQDFYFNLRPCEDGGCVGGRKVANGYWANVIGRYKQGQLLLGSLVEHGVLAGKTRRKRPAWKGESNLPEVEFCVRPAEGGASGECLPWNKAARPASPRGKNI